MTKLSVDLSGLNNNPPEDFKNLPSSVLEEAKGIAREM